jgi:DNA-binding FrmR family transcriptional regulator
MTELEHIHDDGPQTRDRDGVTYTRDLDDGSHMRDHGDGSHTHDHDGGSHVHDHGDGSPAHNHSHTHTHTKAVLNRLSRAIGHLTSVRGMVEEGRSCPEVLMQLAAVRSAINGACEVILKDHLDHCIVDAVKTGDIAAVRELNRAIEMLMR